VNRLLASLQTVMHAIAAHSLHDPRATLPQLSQTQRLLRHAAVMWNAPGNASAALAAANAALASASAASDAEMWYAPALLPGLRHDTSVSGDFFDVPYFNAFLRNLSVAGVQPARTADTTTTFTNGSHEVRVSHAALYAHSPNELLNVASRIAKRADAALPPLFDPLPSCPYGVRGVVSAAAHPLRDAGDIDYAPPGAQCTRAGAVLLNVANVSVGPPLYALPTLMMMHGMPGRHMQAARTLRENGCVCVFVCRNLLRILYFHHLF